MLRTMVTCNFDSMKKVERPRRAQTTSSSNSSGFRLLDDHCDTVSSVSRNSIYKFKIDAMFDDTRSIISQRLDDISRPMLADPRNHRVRQPISSSRGPGSSGYRNPPQLPRQTVRSNSIRSNSNRSNRSNSHRGSSTNLHRSGHRNSGSGSGRGSINSAQSGHRYRGNSVTRTTTTTTTMANVVEYGVNCVNNKVQKQIERMFDDVANDQATCSFAVRCLGSMPLKSKVTSLFELQEPLRQLYLSGFGHNNQSNGHLDICEGGLKIRSPKTDAQMTPFHSIAVWSAVKFVMNQSEGSAAFLPLITDPENLDKKSLFRPLSSSDRRRLSMTSHAPIFTVVMRSKHPNQQLKQLECHAFVCQTPENAIVIAATLYQSLLAHMGGNQNEKPKKPRNQNGVSCVSIASSSVANRRYGSSNASITSSTNRGKPPSIPLPPPPLPSPRMARQPSKTKYLPDNSMSSDTDNVVRNALLETSSSSDQRKKRSYKSRRAPPLPSYDNQINRAASDLYRISSSYRVHQLNAQTRHHYQSTDQLGGDIMTRVAIPRSGSFLNTGGLARYKSRATRRAKSGGGGGSPLGFSELFNEFRLQENLHSLDDILNAIINSEGMSFNDLKPIYKEFLLKLAVTLTKDELYQRSKSIMRRQKKKLMRRKKKAATQYPRKTLFFGSFGLKRVFRFSKYFFLNRKTTSAKSLDGLAKKRVITEYRNTQQITEIHQHKQNYVNHSKKQQQQQQHRSSSSSNKLITSGSDLSETQNDFIIGGGVGGGGQHRNSSSGYGSDACTCKSADRCYCSLVADHHRVSQRLREKNRAAYARNTDTLISCRTDDKCYCSMDDGNESGDLSTATYCDTESCNSITKCYCKHRIIRPVTTTTTTMITKKTDRTCIRDSLALDYELFNTSNDRAHILRDSIVRSREQPTAAAMARGKMRSQEALSVKKSVEMAAVFADVKLSQRTDIKHLAGVRPPVSDLAQLTKVERNNRRNSVASGKSQYSRQSESHRSRPGKIISNVLVAAEQNPIFRKNTQKINEMYQTINPKVVGATLEDTLGYLP